MTRTAVIILTEDGRRLTGEIEMEPRASAIDPEIQTAMRAVAEATDRLERDMHTRNEQLALWRLYKAGMALREIIRTKGF